MNSYDPTLIVNLRDKLVDEFNLHPELYDGCDVENLKQNDWLVKRYLIVGKLNAENAFCMARDAMLWRKSFGVNMRNDTDFPLEFYKLGAYFPYTVDRAGRVIIYARLKLFKSFPKLTQIVRQFVIHMINKIDSQTQNAGWAMVWDMTGAGHSNWQMWFLKFMMTSIRNYFPEGMAYLMLYGSKPLIRTLIKFELTFTPKDMRGKIRFVSNDVLLFSLVAPDNLPDFMGGNCTQDYRQIPDGARNAKEIGIEMGFTLDEINKILKYYDNYLDD